MTRYVSEHPRPTPYQRELLAVLIEECAEVTKEATKILRFGAGDRDPRDPALTNVEKLGRELGDLRAVSEACEAAGLVHARDILDGASAKSFKLPQFLQAMPSDRD